MVARDVCRRVMHSCSPRSVNKSITGMSSYGYRRACAFVNPQRAYSVQT